MDIRNVKHFVLEDYGPLTVKKGGELLFGFAVFCFVSIAPLLFLQIINLSLWLLLIYFFFYMICQLVFAIKYRRSVLALYLYDGTMYGAFVIASLTSELTVLIILNNPYYFLLLPLLVLLTIYLSIKQQNRKLSIPFSEQKLKEKIWRLDKGATAGLYTFIGYLLARIVLPMFSVSTTAMIFFLSQVYFALELSRRSCICFYKIYLIKKYDIDVSEVAVNAARAELAQVINDGTRKGRAHRSYNRYNLN